MVENTGKTRTSAVPGVTALSPVIGYDKASAIAHQANDHGTTLREAALASGYISGTDFDRIVNPSAMVGQ
jgi:fumarate hydratase class II